MQEDPQIINIFLDDSGIFSLSPTQPYFVYAGYVFLGDAERAEANRKYRTLSDAIRAEIGQVGELKASTLENKHRRALVKVLKGYESIACVVFLPRVRSSITQNKLSVHRYKDYAIKIAVKRKLETLISQGKVDVAMPTQLNVFIDEQHTSTDGFYNLEETMREEFVNGIRNLDYGSFHPPLFSSMTIKVKFCDSSGNYLIQASDLLANRMNTSYNQSNPSLRQLPKLNITNLP
ncbi:DUF3800 domain-containing protein [Candidatus Saccharibacteria bacterium]|nr:DUF3800 domain-containing protein [Candidatus Saccharibacteria bacterium]